MVAQYGHNGFGWRMGDVVGMQLVEVPVAGPNAQAFKGLWVTLGALASVFVLSFAIFLLLLRLYVTNPLEFITRVTRSTSLGDAAHGDGDKQPLNGQFHDLAQSIARLRISLDEALKQIAFHRQRDGKNK
jgi:protein-histidine pros-kinase